MIYNFLYPKVVNGQELWKRYPIQADSLNHAKIKLILEYPDTIELYWIKEEELVLL